MKNMCIAKQLLLTGFLALPISAISAQGLQVSCGVRSDSYPGLEDLDQMTPSVALTDRPTSPNGRVNLVQNDSIELWLSSYGYTATDNGIQITSYQLELADLQKGITMTTVSSTADGKMAELSVRTTNEPSQPGTLTVTCFGS